MKKYKSILLMGNIGSGKSTVSQLLSEDINAKQIKADELFKTNPFFKKTLKDRTRWSLTSDLWFLYKRVDIYKNCIKYLKTKHIVIDSGIPMSLVYARSRLSLKQINKHEWNLYKELFDDITEGILKPDIYIFLKTDISHSTQNIVSRGRKFEIKYHSLEYLSELQKSLKYVKRQLKKNGETIIEIDMTKYDFTEGTPISVITNKIKKLL